MTFYLSWIMFLTGEELKEMKNVLKIAPWTKLDLEGDESIFLRMRRERMKGKRMKMKKMNR